MSQLGEDCSAYMIRTLFDQLKEAESSLSLVNAEMVVADEQVDFLMYSDESHSGVYEMDLDKLDLSKVDLGTVVTGNVGIEKKEIVSQPMWIEVVGHNAVDAPALNNSRFCDLFTTVNRRPNMKTVLLNSTPKGAVFFNKFDCEFSRHVENDLELLDDVDRTIDTRKGIIFNMYADLLVEKGFGYIGRGFKDLHTQYNFNTDTYFATVKVDFDKNNDGHRRWLEDLESADGRVFMYGFCGDSKAYASFKKHEKHAS